MSPPNPSKLPLHLGSLIFTKCIQQTTGPKGPEYQYTTKLFYMVHIRPKGPVPVLALEWQISNEVPNNLAALKKAAEAVTPEYVEVSAKLAERTIKGQAVATPCWLMCRLDVESGVGCGRGGSASVPSLLLGHATTKAQIHVTSVDRQAGPFSAQSAFICRRCPRARRQREPS